MPRRLTADIEIFRDREVDKDPPVLRGESESMPRNFEWLPARNVLAVEMHNTLAARNKAHDRFHRRGLAGAVASHQCHDLTAIHLKAKVLENLRGAVPCTQGAYREHRFAHGVAPAKGLPVPK